MFRVLGNSRDWDAPFIKKAVLSGEASEAKSRENHKDLTCIAKGARISVRGSK